MVIGKTESNPRRRLKASGSAIELRPDRKMPRQVGLEERANCDSTFPLVDAVGVRLDESDKQWDCGLVKSSPYKRNTCAVCDGD